MQKLINLFREQKETQFETRIALSRAHTSEKKPDSPLKKKKDSKFMSLIPRSWAAEAQQVEQVG